MECTAVDQGCRHHRAIVQQVNFTLSFKAIAPDKREYQGNTFFISLLASVAQLAVRLTGDQEVVGLTLMVRQHLSCKLIIFSSVFLSFPLIQEE